MGKIKKVLKEEKECQHDNMVLLYQCAKCKTIFRKTENKEFTEISISELDDEQGNLEEVGSIEWGYKW